MTARDGTTLAQDWSRIIRVLHDELLVDEHQLRMGLVTPETRIDSLAVDHLEQLEFAMGIEQEFELHLDDEEIQSWETLQDVLDCVRGEVPA